MAYDGIFIRKTVNELKENIINSRIIKILEPKKSTLEISIKTKNNIKVLKISTLPNCPFLILCDDKDTAPYHAPAWTMILKKYLSGGEIIAINQLGLDKNSDSESIVSLNGYERIVRLAIKNITELGDIQTYFLYIELMGKYSNIILCDENDIIIDAMKRNLSDEMTARDIYPKMQYEPTQIMKQIFLGAFNKFINDSHKNNADYLKQKLNDIENNNTSPCIIYDGNKSIDFYVFTPEEEYLSSLKNPIVKQFKNTSELLENYYDEKASLSLFTIEKQTLANIISLLVEKCNKKIDIKEKDIKNSENYEKYKIFGELIQAFSYDKSKIINNKLVCENYYDNNKTIEIPLDMSITPIENANKYFNKYNKMKRTIEKSLPLLTEEKNKLNHLISMQDSLNFVSNEYDVLGIKKELEDNFYIKKVSAVKRNAQKKDPAIKITHYISSDGIDIYVGKNNIQNEYLTFKIAGNNDTWFHAKNITGSHVIVKCELEKIPHNTLIEAASIAAYFSKNRNENKVEVDYTTKKELKKVKGREPGFCIYHTNFSITVKPALTLKEQ